MTQKEGDRQTDRQSRAKKCRTKQSREREKECVFAQERKLGAYKGKKCYTPLLSFALHTSTYLEIIHSLYGAHMGHQISKQQNQQVSIVQRIKEFSANYCTPLFVCICRLCMPVSV